MKTQPAGPFLGLNNRLPDYALETENGRWLREAVNVDIDNAGRVRRRDGVATLQAMTGAHSVYALSATTGLFVRASALYSFVTSPTYAETLIAVLASNAAMSYCEHNGSVYYGNKTDSGRIVSGVRYPWALPTPAAPTVATTTGTLAIGAYQVAVRYINTATGEAGGLSASSVRELSAAGGVRVTLPASTTGATHIQVFVSQLNGSEVYLYSTVAVGTATVDIASVASTTTTGEQGYFEPMPSCDNLFVHMGKLCGASGKRLYYGASYRLGYYAPTDGYIDFEDNIAVAVPNQFGVYVVTEKRTYWLPGDLKKTESLREPLPYGGVAGSAFAHPYRPLVGWFSAKGFVLGDEQGVVTALSASAVDVTPSGAGCTGVFTSRGYSRAVSSGYCINLDNSAVTTYADFAFTSMSGAFGTKADGLYWMTGAQKVDARIRLGRTNFGAENLKALPACYIGAASGEPMELVVVTADEDEYVYEARSSSSSVEIHRIDTGKGLRENWYDLSLRNVDGSDFILASVSFAPVASGRRI